MSEAAPGAAYPARMRTWVLGVLVGVLAVALIATSTLAYGHARALDRHRGQIALLTDEVAMLREQVAELERGGPGPGNAGDPLDGLLGGLLDDLLGGLGGDLGDLGDLGGLLDGLLGGWLDGGDIGAAPPGAACLVPDGPDVGGGLFDGLLDGLLGDVATSPGPDDLDAVVAQVAAQVAELRGLDWEQPVEVAFLDDAATRARLAELVEPDLASDDIVIDQRLLVTLGALPEGADLAELQLDLLGEQVAGFYVPETGELVVRVPDDGVLRPLDRVTLAHELHHALADQVLGLPDRTTTPYVDDPDASYAALAVVEGDATLLMQQWALAHLSIADQLALALDPSIAAAGASLDDAPHVLRRALTAPYEDGLDWVCERYLDGGWDAVDAAYASPPTTSAEVLFGAPVEPRATAPLHVPDGFVELRTAPFGAATLSWLLEAPGDDRAAELPDARERVRGWAGGTALVAANGATTAVGLSLVDGGTGSVPLCATVDAWYAAANPGARRSLEGDDVRFDRAGQAAVVRCDGDDVLLGIAPDGALALQLVGG